LALRLKPIIEARAKERMIEGINQYSPVQISAQGYTGKTRDELAKIAGVSHDTIEKFYF
jgi:GTP cyclohydrolase III